MKISKREYENLIRDSEMVRILSSVMIKADEHIDKDLLLNILGFIPEPDGKSEPPVDEPIPFIDAPNPPPLKRNM